MTYSVKCGIMDASQDVIGIGELIMMGVKYIESNKPDVVYEFSHILELFDHLVKNSLNSSVMVYAPLDKTIMITNGITSVYFKEVEE